MIPRGIFSLACFALDTWFYSTPTFTPYAFLLQNVYHSISLFYGINSTHFYLSQGIPVLLLTQLPFFLHGISLKGEEELKWVMGGTVGIYSLLGHKEVRFLMPLLPLMHLFIAKSLVKLYISSSSTTFSNSKSNEPKSLIKNFSTRVKISPNHLVILLISLLPAFYLNVYHSIGQISVMDHLRALHYQGLAVGGEGVRSVGFLMPCHSTPWMSHLHLEHLDIPLSSDCIKGKGGAGGGSGDGGKIWFLTCEPPILYVPPPPPPPTASREKEELMKG